MSQEPATPPAPPAPPPEIEPGRTPGPEIEPAGSPDEIPPLEQPDQAEPGRM